MAENEGRKRSTARVRQSSQSSRPTTPPTPHHPIPSSTPTSPSLSPPSTPPTTPTIRETPAKRSFPTLPPLLWCLIASFSLLVGASIVALGWVGGKGSDVGSGGGNVGKVPFWEFPEEGEQEEWRGRVLEGEHELVLWPPLQSTPRGEALLLETARKGDDGYFLHHSTPELIESGGEEASSSQSSPPPSFSTLLSSPPSFFPHGVSDSSLHAFPVRVLYQGAWYCLGGGGREGKWEDKVRGRGEDWGDVGEVVGWVEELDGGKVEVEAVVRWRVREWKEKGVSGKGKRWEEGWRDEGVCVWVLGEEGLSHRALLFLARLKGLSYVVQFKSHIWAIGKPNEDPRLTSTLLLSTLPTSSSLSHLKGKVRVLPVLNDMQRNNPRVKPDAPIDQVDPKTGKRIVHNPRRRQKKDMGGREVESGDGEL